MKRPLMLMLAAGAIVGGANLPTAQAADIGDGSLICNSGEICFSRDATNTRYQKHFWYAASHSGYQYTDTTNGSANQGNVQDSADQIWQRDTVCDVKVIAVEFGIDDSQTINNNASNVWQGLQSQVRNDNDKHERINC